MEPPEPSIQGVTAEESSLLYGDERAEEEVYRRAIADYDRKRARHVRKHQQSIRFPHGPVALFFGGDEHFGDTGSDVKRVFYEAEMVANTPGCYWVRTGDVVNQFILGRMRQIRDGARMAIPDEWLLAKKLGRLIAPRVVAWMSGNHDLWHEIASGVDYLPDVLAASGCRSPLYDKHEIYFDVRVGGLAPIPILVRHRWKGSSQYNDTHPVEVAMRFHGAPDFRIGVMAHTHRSGLFRPFAWRGQTRAAIISGAYKRLDSYAAQLGVRSHNESTAIGCIITHEGHLLGGDSVEAVCDYMRVMYRRAA